MPKVRAGRTALVARDCPFEDLEPVPVRCPACRERGFEPVRGRFGPIWRCENRPDCKLQYTSMPLGRSCRYERNGKVCGQMMVEGTKTIPDRCSDRDCPNRNPHKLEEASKK